MSLDDDIVQIAEQERKLRFDSFDETSAWELGTIIRDEATQRGTPVAIDIRTHGRPLFYYAMAGTTADNAEWLRRKRNVTLRYFRSSYGFGRELLKKDATLGPDRGVDPLDYAPHGGSFPIHINGTGVIGAITVSGPPQRDDHNLVVAAICRYLKVPADTLALGPE
jgi:uncharacterized protein (UPF0303 family)